MRERESPAESTALYDTKRGREANHHTPQKTPFVQLDLTNTVACAMVLYLHLCGGDLVGVRDGNYRRPIFP